MSTRAVRTLSRQWATGQAVPYVDTVNFEVNPANDIWFTLEFSAYGMDKLSYCNAWQEVGTIQLDFFGIAGVGDDALLEAAEPVARKFFESAEQDSRMTFTTISAPDDFTPTGGVPKFGVSFTISYTFNL
jgi:hypothetical protein